MQFDGPGGLTPRVIPWSPRFPLDAVMARLSAVPRHIIVRITGGCGEMSEKDAQGVLELFHESFQGFNGALLIGGTRMICHHDPNNVLFGITEVGPAIRRGNSTSFVLGVVPRCESFGFDSEHPVIVVNQTEEVSASDGQEREFITIIHPDQDFVIAATTPLTKDAIWYDEVEFCRYITHNLIEFGSWQSLLVAYNGGGVTEREVRATAARGWPVLLVNGSGRKCDELAKDGVFLTQHPSVRVCERNPKSMRAALQLLGVVDPSKQSNHLRLIG
jgi:hypothetical protein